MQAWYLNENPYPLVPQDVLDAADSVRGSLPNKYCDPKIAADLFDEALDEYLLCDDIGINIVSNEHHAGINCLFGASPLILGAFARQTKNVRILSLGTLVTVRKDPVRVAEEYAMADVMCRGRLEIGFVKSGGSEMASGNANPIGIVDRYWEAIDLIIKTLSHRDGPFSWEGKYFTHRHVNIWPGPWQQPHPPLWAATGDPTTSAELGRRGIVNVMVFRSIEETQRAWGAYRQARTEAGLPAPGPDRFGHTAFVYTADTDEEGITVASKLLCSSTPASGRRRNTASSCQARSSRSSRRISIARSRAPARRRPCVPRLRWWGSPPSRRSRRASCSRGIPTRSCAR